MNRALVRLATSLGFAVACFLTPLAAHAQVNVDLAFGPSYAVPTYTPAFAAVPTGCPDYSAGQWAWDGYQWMWCPATDYVPIGASALVGSYGFSVAVPPPTIAVAPAYYEPPAYYAPTAYFQPPAYYAPTYYTPSLGFYGSASPGLNFFVGLNSLSFYAPQPVAYSAPFVAAYPYAPAFYPATAFVPSAAFVATPTFVT